MPAEWTPAELADFRAENSAKYDAQGLGHSCLFDSTMDGDIPDGCDCGGCACHLSAPCNHCIRHLDPDESWHIGTMLAWTGRWTR